MKVTLYIHGYHSRYALIEGDGFNLDVRITPGLSVPEGLLQFSAEHEAKADRMLKWARAARLAAHIYEQENQA